MVIQINLSNKTFYLLVGSLVALCVAVVVIAYNSGNPQVHGHGANEIIVTINGQQMTLQDAMEQGVLGRNLICASFRRIEGGNATFVGSTDGNTYDPQEVVNEIDPNLTYPWSSTIAIEKNGLECKNGWIMTGCADFGDGHDTDERMYSSNACIGDSKDNSPDVIYIRCCKII